MWFPWAAFKNQSRFIIYIYIYIYIYIFFCLVSLIKNNPKQFILCWINYFLLLCCYLFTIFWPYTLWSSSSIFTVGLAVPTNNCFWTNNNTDKENSLSNTKWIKYTPFHIFQTQTQNKFGIYERKKNNPQALMNSNLHYIFYIAYIINIIVFWDIFK